jgi:2-phospho-L-lactate guanylyltransferase
VSAHVLVPVKRLNGAKSRLAAALTPEERAGLMLELVHGVVAAALEADVGPVTLVTAESLSVPGASVWDDRGREWNDALTAAMREVVSEPVATIVSADLPTLRAEEVIALVEATPERGLAIARASDAGTNAVSMRPPAAMVTCFGEPQSAALHAARAQAAGLTYEILDLPGLAFDLDRPEDLERLRAFA